jgi:hypothetical protein
MRTCVLAEGVASFTLPARDRPSAPSLCRDGSSCLTPTDQPCRRSCAAASYRRARPRTLRTSSCTVAWPVRHRAPGRLRRRDVGSRRTHGDPLESSGRRRACGAWNSLSGREHRGFTTAVPGGLPLERVGRHLRGRCRSRAPRLWCCRRRSQIGSGSRTLSSASPRRPRAQVRALTGQKGRRDTWSCRDQRGSRDLPVKCRRFLKSLSVFSVGSGCSACSSPSSGSCSPPPPASSSLRVVGSQPLQEPRTVLDFGAMRVTAAVVSAIAVALLAASGAVASGSSPTRSAVITRLQQNCTNLNEETRTGWGSGRHEKRPRAPR